MSLVFRISLLLNVLCEQLTFRWLFAAFSSPFLLAPEELKMQPALFPFPCLPAQLHWLASRQEKQSLARQIERSSLVVMAAWHQALGSQQGWCWGGSERACVSSPSTLAFTVFFTLSFFALAFLMHKLSMESSWHTVSAFSQPPQNALWQLRTAAWSSQWGREGVRRSESSAFCSRQFLQAFEVTGQFAKLPR